MSPAGFQATFAPGIILKDVVNDRFTESMPPPPPGGSQIHSFDSRMQFMMSTDGGNSFRPGLAFARMEVRVASFQDEGFDALLRHGDALIEYVWWFAARGRDGARKPQ